MLPINMSCIHVLIIYKYYNQPVKILSAALLDFIIRRIISDVSCQPQVLSASTAKAVYQAGHAGLVMLMINLPSGKHTVTDRLR